MIRVIAAIDGKRGLADEAGVPWLGRLPSDAAYYRDKIKGGLVLMGYPHYLEISRPYEGAENFVATRRTEALKPGFQPVSDARVFLSEHAAENVWSLAGEKLLADTFDLAEELYLTRLTGDFKCTKFFPVFTDQFDLVSRTPPATENGITFRFEIWRRRFS
jgi:dihydrofolate reductase